MYRGPGWRHIGGRIVGVSRTAVGFTLMALIGGATGCAGRQVAASLEQVRRLATQARDNGALHCAPRQLAMADTHAEFAASELNEGDYFRARDHLQVADDNAREALRLSGRGPSGQCLVATSAAPPTTTAAAVDADADGDGILDAADRCPAQAEDKDGFEDSDGCPDPDNDRDGVADAPDHCPLEPEDRDGFQDGDGCPDPDNDQDGVADGADKCPLKAEDRDGFEDADGCPDPDNDLDGLADGEDKCPLEAGPVESAGCPQKYEHIQVTAEKIELKQKIFFETNKAAIMSRSYGLLAEIANVLQTRPTMRLRIEGHTDTRGTPRRNMSLSAERANEVRAHLMGLGIAGERLEARGYGSAQPIETNKTGAGRERNRRVEFVITQQ